MNPNKTLIINPTKDEQKTLTLITYEQLILLLFKKVFGTTDVDFKEVLFSEKHARHFLANVESRTVAVSKYANKPLKTFDEALAYLNQIGNEVYGLNWKTKLVRNEITLTKPDNFGLAIPDEGFIKSLKEELVGLVQLKVNVPKSKEAKAETQAQTNNQNTGEN